MLPIIPDCHWIPQIVVTHVVVADVPVQGLRLPSPNSTLWGGGYLVELPSLPLALLEHFDLAGKKSEQYHTMPLPE